MPVIGAPVVVSAVTSACQAAASGKSESAAKIGPADLVVSWNEMHQTMAGFGASDKYHEAMDDEQADLLFSVDKGIGLSLLRVAIDPNGDYIGQYSNAKLAAARGAAVWATPWSPPAEWKDNQRTSKGGHLRAAHYADWAARLAARSMSCPCLQSAKGIAEW